MDSSNGYSVPPPPTLPANGSIPARRLPAQNPEPPACVQNAMMTKDKKPFTYTPGGIDLSQIKSPRMAKRIARNAQHEGVTNQPKPSPLAQEQHNYNTAGNAAPPPASAMGLPVQVFPTGPPPPPPPPQNSSSSSSTSTNVPPPPPPMSSQLLPQSNGRDTRKSPTPQNFEPPPLGCRPEIKIPPNPMATLRKVPKPEPKNDFWIEEYRKDRSKSPMAGEITQQESNANNQEFRQQTPPRLSSPPTTKPTTIKTEDETDPRKDPNRIAFQQQRQPSSQQQSSPPQPPPMMMMSQPQMQRPVQQQPSYPPQMDPNRIAFQRQQQQQQQPSEMSPNRTPAGYYYQQPPQQRPQPTLASPNVQRVDSPLRVQDNSNLQRSMSPNRTVNSTSFQQQSPQSPYYGRTAQQQYQQPQQQPRQFVTSPPPQQKPTQVGSLYIAPVSPENLVNTNEPPQQQQQQTPRSAGIQQTPPWLSQRPNMKENPDWIREVNSPITANRTQTPPIVAPNNLSSQPNNGSPAGGLRLQITPNNYTSSNPKEHIIPIQLEKTPTPTRTPSTPAFGPQPYSPNNQYGSVTSPGSSGYSTPMGMVRNPNQFVDQGYNSFANQWQNQQQQSVQPQRVMSPPAQQGGGRVIPITVERDEGPFSPTAVRGPISPAPMVIQNDPRAQPQSRSPNGIPPNQSKSFRVLQQITDTTGGAEESDGDEPVELHAPQYSKQMGEATDQVRRMQINDGNQQQQQQQQQAFVNRGPIQRPTQRYVQQRPIYQQDDQPQEQQQYVHPSEQQVQEPKIYTGSAIPSRSFKLLQAMTTPENAGPGQSDL